MFSFICDGNLKKAVWDGQRSLGRQCPFFLGVCVCVCLWGGGWAGWALSCIKCCSTSKILVTLIFHDHLHYCEIFLARFLISFENIEGCADYKTG